MLVENHSGEGKWVPGVVLEKLGPTLYRVRVRDKVWKRHIDQMLENKADSHEEMNTDDDDDGFKGVAVENRSFPAAGESEPSANVEDPMPSAEPRPSASVDPMPS